MNIVLVHLPQSSTKAFTAQVTVLTLMALSIARKKGAIPESKYQHLAVELSAIPDKVADVLATEPLIRELSEEFKDVAHFLYLGRGYNFPVALEGALKLKEISYIHAEGYPAAEMKHGPIALIDENMPVVVLATNRSAYEKIVSNIQEVKARKGRVIAIVSEEDEATSSATDMLTGNFDGQALRRAFLSVLESAVRPSRQILPRSDPFVRPYCCCRNRGIAE